MKHSIRWFVACAAIALLQWWSWTGMAKEDGDWIGFWDWYLYSFAIICFVAWCILPQQRPLGFDRGPRTRARLGLKEQDGGHIGVALAAVDDWLDRHIKPSRK